MSRWSVLRRLAVVSCTMALALAVGGCIVEESPPPPPPDTEIGFDEQMNFGVGCGVLTSWSVTMRETQETLVGGCDDQVTFGGLVPNTSYTFDLAGYQGNTLCWQGSCSVPTEAGVLTWGDCAQQIQSLCP
jgi:hypothetical protein